MATSPNGRRLRRRSAAVLATATLSLAALAGPARAAAGPIAHTPHSASHPASAAGWAFPADAPAPAPPPAMPADLNSSGSAQVQALEQKYETDAATDEQKANQLADEKTSLEQRAGDVQNRENALATQAANLESQATALNSQAATLSSEIDAHNAEPHTFQLPDQEAAYAAYNEEKANLDAQKASLQNKLNALTAQSDKLQGDQAKAQADETKLEADVQTHNDAVAALEGDVGKLADERQQIMAQIADLMQSEADAQQEGGAATPEAEGGDDSEPPAAAAPPAQAQALPSSGGDEAAPPESTYAPVENAPVANTTAEEPTPTQTPVTVRLAPSTVKGLPASQAENLQPSQAFDGLIPEANGDYAAEELQPPAGESVPAPKKAFGDVINNGGKATTSIGGKPATVDRVVPVTAEPDAEAGGDTPRPEQAAPKKAAPGWTPTPNQPAAGSGPPVSIDALKSMLDQDGLGKLADQFDLEYQPVVLDRAGNPTYGSAPTDAEGNPELGADGKPILRFSDLGLQNPSQAENTFDDEALNPEREGDPSPASPCGQHSFSGSTKVLMADGSAKAIAGVHAGDLVENAQPGGGPEVHRVDQVHVTTTDADFTDVTVGTGTPAGGGTITGTANHPYYDVSIGGFVDAGSLGAGDRLQSSTSAQATVTSVRPHVGPMVTYDLTIDGLHTYYVIAGATPVLVHNQDACVPATTNWNPKSVKTWGHTFNEHGAGAKNFRSLTDRARSTGNPQGQWLNNQAAADFLSKAYVPGSGPYGIRLPAGLGQVIMPDGAVLDAPYAYIVPNPNGIIRTAYPTIGEP